MNWFSDNWIQPLQRRVKTELPPEKTSFLRAWSIISPILIYYVSNSIFIILSAYMIQGISVLDGKWMPLSEWLRVHSTMVSGVLNGIAMLIGTAVVYPLFRREAPQISLPVSHKKDIPLLFILGASVALCFNILFSLLQITGSSQSYAEVADKQFALPLWAGIILYGLISPLAEEIVFRGLVYNRICRQYGLTIAVIGSALLFGVYHGNVVQALYGFILGLLMAVFYERYASFIVPVLLHGAANICVYVISSNTDWQQMVMNRGVCAVSAMAALVILWIVFRRKNNDFTT